MIRRGFLDRASRKDLIELARDGSAAHRLARRANALVLLDNGMSCAQVAQVLLLDDDTVRTWHRLYLENGIEGLAGFGYEGSECRLNETQQTQLQAWIAEALPRSANQVGAFIAREFGFEYQARSGVIALPHRLGFAYRRPKAIARKLDAAKQAAFIKKYESLLNHLGDDEAVLFGDAVHPIHGAQPVGCRAPKEANIAVPQTTRRQGLNIHGALDLESAILSSVIVVAALGQSCESQPNSTQTPPGDRQSACLRQTLDGRYGRPISGHLHHQRGHDLKISFNRREINRNGRACFRKAISSTATIPNSRIILTSAN